MNADEAHYWAHEILPEDAQNILKQAAREVQNVGDPAVRANRVDFAIYMVHTTYPQFFKE
ncbi:hypothetical protein [Burkholderia ubonensis]|uniref:hypothetical protein n=1 Tax=Burkholderia ubonensis TaxID=101571 RepID=UPI000753A917|nr:hypothetical protein [Burkholderia ubonensis]AOI70861.1 hypothetical protein WI31_15685 [Burkholderia ubonensis]KUZ07406.1 hypothetical protein WI29_34140 [Burkholderia ubonensis]KUZ20646.1 hypothetical protein WI30_01325 [Burkholderia ubonensis]KUZ42053.1 hypothetical protein WI32_03170 [Burkholderia ubonensis]KUZ56859.1 hypothetical protein WI33_04705 [Burkholderia ubonensis]